MAKPTPVTIKERYKLEGYNELQLSNGTFGHREGWLVVFSNGTRAWMSDSEMGRILAEEAAEAAQKKQKATARKATSNGKATEEDDS